MFVGGKILSFSKKNAFYRISDLQKKINDNKPDLTKRFENALTVLGDPYSGNNSTRMEYGGEFDNSSFNFSLNGIDFTNLGNQDAGQALEKYLNIQI